MPIKDDRINQSNIVLVIINNNKNNNLTLNALDNSPEYFHLFYLFLINLKTTV